MQKKTFQGEIAAEIDHIAKQIVVPRPTSRIVSAADALRPPREKRAIVDAALQEAIDAFRAGKIDQKKVHELAREKELHDGIVAKRRSELAAARLDYQEEFETALIPGALAVVSLANELVNLLEQVLMLATDAQQCCLGQGMEAPSPIVRANAARQALYVVRQQLDLG